MSLFANLRAGLMGYHPRSVPLMSRLSYQRELFSWSFMPLMLSGLQAGTIAIFLKKTYATVPGISEWQLNFAVSVLAAAKCFGFLASFLWASLSRGKPKVSFMVALQLSTAATIAIIAAAPLTKLGMWMVTCLCIVAWSIWSGVMTLRTGVWRANYPDAYRPRIAGLISSVDGLVGAVAGLTMGLCLDQSADSFRILFLVMAAVGVCGAMLYRRMPFRRQGQHLSAEARANSERRPSLSPLVIARVLRDDRWYRGYMACMFVMGFGNLMLHPLLTIALTDEFDVSYANGILISTVLPLLFMILAIPFWSRRLARLHVIEFRAVHVWVFAAASTLTLLGVLLHQMPLLYLSSMCLGIGFGGGVLAWNLGHQHFAPPHRDAEYMGVHITLTGVRGIIGPILGVQLYGILSQRISQTQALSACFAICLATNLVGAVGFVLLMMARRRAKAIDQRQDSSRREELAAAS